MTKRKPTTIPVSGSEVPYGDPRWDTEVGIASNNCYSYAMNDYRNYRPRKAVVGDLGGFEQDIRYNSCPPLKHRLLRDNPNKVYKEHPMRPCKPGFYKIMMFASSDISGDGYGDFHFYKHHRDVVYTVQKGDTTQSIASFFDVPAKTIREGNNGKAKVKEGDTIRIPNISIFSHKRGWATPSLLHDACGKSIKDPRTACRAYELIYDKFCGSYCVRANAVKTSS